MEIYRGSLHSICGRIYKGHAFFPNLGNRMKKTITNIPAAKTTADLNITIKACVYALMTCSLYSGLNEYIACTDFRTSRMICVKEAIPYQ